MGLVMFFKNSQYQLKNNNKNIFVMKTLIFPTYLKEFVHQ